MPKFTLAPLAETDLKAIWNYISEYNEDSANKFIRDISKKFELLAQNNQIGRRRDDFIIEMRVFPFKKYYIYYFPNEEGVEIYRVLHGSRDIESEFEDYFEGLKE